MHPQGVDNYAEEPIFYSEGAGHSYADGVINIQHIMRTMSCFNAFFMFMLIWRANLEDKCGLGVQWKNMIDKENEGVPSWNPRRKLKPWQKVKIEVFAEEYDSIRNKAQKIWPFIEEFGKIKRTKHSKTIAETEDRQYQSLENYYTDMINGASVGEPTDLEYRNKIEYKGDEKEDIDWEPQIHDKKQSVEMWFAYFKYTADKLAAKVPEFKEIAPAAVNAMSEVMEITGNPDTVLEIRKKVELAIKNHRGVILTGELGVFESFDSFLKNKKYM